MKYSSAAFFNFLKQNRDTIPRIGSEIIKVFEANLLDDRVTSPLLNFLDVVLSSNILQPLLNDKNSNFPDEIFRLVCLEVKGHKKLYKTTSSINVFCHLIQVNNALVFPYSNNLK